MIFYADQARQFREDAHLTQEDVGTACGVTAQAVGFWERGKNKPLPAKVRRMAKLYRCLVSDISDLKPGRRESLQVALIADGMQNYRVRDLLRVPIYGLAMAKGVTDWHGDMVPDGEYQLDTIELPDDGRRWAAFRVEGDSMEPEIRDGAIALCDLDAEPSPGNIVVAKWNDAVMVKRYRRFGRQIVLESANTRYDPIPVRPEWMLRVRRVMFEV